MSQTHPSATGVERGGLAAFELIAALVLTQAVLVPLTWVTINHLFYGSPESFGRYAEWSMTATLEATVLLQIIAHLVAALMIATYWWARSALRDRTITTLRPDEAW